jgi:hypothetical protein
MPDISRIGQGNSNGIDRWQDEERILESKKR